MRMSRPASGQTASPNLGATRCGITPAIRWRRIATLPVAEVVAPDALLFFWTTGPLISIGAHIPVVRAWGFEPTAMGFVWLKLNPKASSVLFTERDLFLALV